ncbi:MAG: valine--tRNA ligase [Christensenellaceae bacterium]|nr:valine--tRNA ligase [Christensenellaceae bacterium]
MSLPKHFDPASFENAIYKNWEDKGYFTPEITTDKSPFCVVIPPPNITGQLHMGHALNSTLQDIIIRHKRMQGFATLWLPGTDHASIATETKIVGKLKEEGLSKADVGRDAFLERAFKWKDQYGRLIVDQLKRLGSSCDWSREAFTMDEKCSKAVKDAFVRLYHKKMIYRGKRMINWCPCCKTALSDAEVDYSAENSYLWYINYPFVDDSGFVTVATTRPETILGDVAVAVNPEDPKYKEVIGKHLKLPLTSKTIPIIADNYVEIEFGTGAVKITPAHDPNDFEVGLRHKLQLVNVMDDAGYMNNNANEYAGMNRFEAREKIVTDLEKQGLLEKIEPYTHNVGHCSRCDSVVEPRASLQWFVKMQALAKPAIRVVKERKIVFIPDRFSNVYLNWMNNIKDWCISRQLWWGHRIPAWYCTECNNIIVDANTPTHCSKCGCTNLIQDEDVLDTWFSSALWPFSTLGYPEMTADLKYFYPTNVLVTGYDIIFFWVARMIFSGIEHMGEIPFPEVLIHGLVRDADGKKMSKSAGNGVDPIEIIDRFGADTLRFNICTGMAPGADIRYSEEKIENSRNFLNKLWNSARFVLMNSENVKLPEIGEFSTNSADKWILYKMNSAISEVSINLKKYDIGLAGLKLYDFIWSDFCDWYIELCKANIYGNDVKARERSLAVLMFVLKNILKLLHPFTPFITERIWQEVGENRTIMLTKYPSNNSKFSYLKDFKRFESIKEIIRAVRNIRAEYDVAPSKTLSLFILSNEKIYIKKNLQFINKLANILNVTFIADKGEITEKTVGVSLDGIELYVPLGEIVSFEKEITRLNKEIQKVKEEISRSEKLLNTQGFVAKAPKNLISQETEKLKINRELCFKLESRVSEMSK